MVLDSRLESGTRFQNNYLLVVLIENGVLSSEIKKLKLKVASIKQKYYDCVAKNANQKNR